MPRSFRFALAALVCSALAVLGGCHVVADDHGASLEKSLTLLAIQSRSTDPATRANCVEALQRSGDPRATAVIEQGLHDTDWVVRFASAMTIARRTDAAQYKPVLVDLAAKDPNDSVRAASIYALRRLGDTANMNALARYLESPDWSVRANTSMALGLMQDPSAIPLLLSLTKETDPRVKFEITAALARLGNERAQRLIIVDALSNIAEDHWNAMMVCGDLPPDIAANPLILGLVDAPPQATPDVRPLTVRRQLIAARSLGKLGSPQFETPPGRKTPLRTPAEIAISNLDNTDPSLRALAALALGEMLVPRQASALAPLLGDQDPGVQRAAAAAIVNIYARTPKQ